MSLNDTYRGLRVLDLGTNIAAPFAAMILGDMGADVIKIERPPIGDDTRALPPYWNGDATVFLAMNRNKRSVLLDMKTADGRGALWKLIESAERRRRELSPRSSKEVGIGIRRSANA